MNRGQKWKHPKSDPIAHRDHYSKQWHPKMSQLNKTAMSKERDHIKLVQNTGKFNIENIPFHRYESTLQSIWRQYHSPNTHYIEKVIILCGPPGAGKSKICEYVARYYHLDTIQAADYLLDGSQMASDVMKENGRKLIESKMIEKLFQPILQNQHRQKLFIIDGFLRMKRHVFTVDFLRRRLQSVNFFFLVLDVDEETSVRRQIERGKALKRMMESDGDQEQKEQSTKKIKLKASDLNEEDARKRYRKYAYLLNEVRNAMESVMKLQIEVIDGSRGLHAVQQMVEAQLKRVDGNSNDGIHK